MMENRRIRAKRKNGVELVVFVVNGYCSNFIKASIFMTAK